MKPLFSVRSAGLIVLAALLAPVAAFAQSTVTINFFAGGLANSSGTLLTTGTLVLLIADTGDNGFGSLAAGSSLSLGSLLNGDDQIIGSGTVLSGGYGQVMGSTGTGGNSSIPLMTSPYTNLNTGDPLAIVWLPGLNSSSTTLSGGQTYGLYQGVPPESDSDAWVVPLGGTTDTQLTFITTADTADGGTAPASDGYASFTVSAVPEPADFSLIAGAAGCLAVMGQRFRSRKARPPAN